MENDIRIECLLIYHEPGNRENFVNNLYSKSGETAGIKYWLSEMESYRIQGNNSEAENARNEALKYIGYSLHPIQDYYSHSDYYVKWGNKKDAIRIISKEHVDWNNKIPFKATWQINNGVEGFWYHSGRTCDTVAENYDAMQKTATETKDILWALSDILY
ncbi:MAG: hypothetical protein ACOX45_08040 [Acutalibacteraceae bacterium]